MKLTIQIEENEIAKIVLRDLARRGHVENDPNLTYEYYWTEDYHLVILMPEEVH